MRAHRRLITNLPGSTITRMPRIIYQAHSSNTRQTFISAETEAMPRAVAKICTVADQSGRKFLKNRIVSVCPIGIPVGRSICIGGRKDSLCFLTILIREMKTRARGRMKSGGELEITVGKGINSQTPPTKNRRGNFPIIIGVNFTIKKLFLILCNFDLHPDTCVLQGSIYITCFHILTSDVISVFFLLVFFILLDVSYFIPRIRGI